MAVNSWYMVQQMNERKWICGHCGQNVAGNAGYYKNEASHPGEPLAYGDIARLAIKRLVICPGCEKPTYFEGQTQIPGSAFGRQIQHLPPELEAVYTEARN